MWNDPVWLRWQIEHQKIGDPSAYSLWLMKKTSLVIRVNILPMMQALNKATISAAEVMNRFGEVFRAGELSC